MSPDFEWLGNLPVPPDVPAEVNAYAGWRSPLHDVVWQRHWDTRVPEAAKEAYRRASTAAPVTVAQGEGQATLTNKLSHWTPTAPVDWTLLDQLPQCTGISWSGPDEGLTETLARHPLITSLNWADAPPVVDLRDTCVRSLRIAGDALREVRLPSDAYALWLGPTKQRCTVHAADEGRWLTLDLYQVTASTQAPHGLAQARSVELIGDSTFSAATLAGFTAAHSVRLHWTSPPGRLEDSSLLANLRSLRLLEMVDAYGLDATTIPDLPALRHLDIFGLRGSVARELRARFRRTELTLSLTGAKTDRWLAANLDNPLRDWVDDHKRAGTAACKAYATALRAIDKLPAVPSPATPSPDAPATVTHSGALAPTPPARDSPAPDTLAPPSPLPNRLAPGSQLLGDAESVLRAFVETLNAIDDKYEIIDTLRREEAGDAFAALATRAGVPSGTADNWFDQWRDF